MQLTSLQVYICVCVCVSPLTDLGSLGADRENSLLGCDGFGRHRDRVGGRDDDCRVREERIVWVLALSVPDEQLVWVGEAVLEVLLDDGDNLANE